MSVAVCLESFRCPLEGAPRVRQMRMDNILASFIRRVCVAFSFSLRSRERQTWRQKKGTVFVPFCFLFRWVREASCRLPALGQWSILMPSRPSTAAWQPEQRPLVSLQNRPHVQSFKGPAATQVQMHSLLKVLEELLS